MSRGFVCSLVGIGVTVLSWYGPWSWPAFPAFALLGLVFGDGAGYHELEPGGRAAVITGLIAFNSAVWAGVVWAIYLVVSRGAARRSIG
jgi:hypothetical protein